MFVLCALQQDGNIDSEARRRKSDRLKKGGTFVDSGGRTLSSGQLRLRRSHYLGKSTNLDLVVGLNRLYLGFNRDMSQL